MQAFILTSLLSLALVVNPAWSKTVDQTQDKQEKASEKSQDKADGKSADGDEVDTDIGGILDGMGYPELQVVPRASERLRIEAKAESGSWWVMHWPVQLSGLATLGVGLMDSQDTDLNAEEKDSAENISLIAKAVGAGWLVGGVILGAQRPYSRGQKSVSKINEKSERATLLKERMAEEVLERPARTMRVLQHVSVATNFSVNVLSAMYADKQGTVVAGVAALLSFLPYMFEDHTVSVYNKHTEYKRKIYTPIKGASVYVDPETKKLTPLTTLAWTF